MKLFIVGGFLGSGKTTAIRQACSSLRVKGKSVAVITNDQGTQLVDSGFMRAGNIPVCEVTGGCFCCNYPDLYQHIGFLANTAQPDALFAESVGSCTDLIATVVNPLRQRLPDLEIVVSIFVDARLLLNRLQETALPFDESIQYIYDKQLEEADLLLLNKSDLLDDKDRQVLALYLGAKFPRKKILFQDTYDSACIETWLDELDHFSCLTPRAALNLDYDRYGKGESMLAWLDETIELASAREDAPAKALHLAHRIYRKVKENSLPLGHLKFLLSDGRQQYKISFTATSDSRPDGELLKEQKGREVSLMVNARVQTDPAMLSQLVADAVQETLATQASLNITVSAVDSFQPAYPRPTYRIVP